MNWYKICKISQKIKLDHVYLPCKDLDKSVEFYEKILDKKISNIEGDRWADFNDGKNVFLGLKNIKYLPKSHQKNNNIVLLTTDLDIAYTHIKSIAKDIKSVGQDNDIDFVYEYFVFNDPDGNAVTVAKYNKSYERNKTYN